MSYYNLYWIDNNGVSFGEYGLTKQEILAITKAIIDNESKIRINGRVFVTTGRNFQYYQVYEQYGNQQQIQDYFKKQERINGFRVYEIDISEAGKKVTEEIFNEASGKSEPIVKGFKENEVLHLWALLHPNIVEVSKKLFCEENYKEAVQAAITEVNERVRKIFLNEVGSEKQGTDLMFNAFNQDNPVIKIINIEDSITKGIQEGYKFIFAGATLAIRNPKAHQNFEIERKDAVELLFLCSRLMRKVDERIVTP